MCFVSPRDPVLCIDMDRIDKLGTASTVPLWGQPAYIARSIEWQTSAILRYSYQREKEGRKVEE
jgi:hypothetical protein